MNALITGPSGAGKSTVIRELQTRGLDDIEISDDQKYGEHPKNDKSKWELNLDKIKERMSKQPDFILAAVGMNWDQLAQLPWDYVILLNIQDREEQRKRVMTRKDNLYFQQYPDEVNKMLAWSEQMEEALIGRGAIPLPVDEMTPHEIADAIIHQVGR